MIVKKTKQSVLKKLKKIMMLKGPVYVAYHLGFRETVVLHKWQRESYIPARSLVNVENFLKSESINALQ